MIGLAFLLIILAMIFGMYAQSRVQGSYKKWSQQGSRSGVTGRDAARYVMEAAGIHDVEITSTHGHLTDHYDPVNKRLVLSEANYNGRSLAAVGVAAHEAGHAIQHKTGYAMLKARMALVPVVGIANNVLMFVMFGGLFFVGWGHGMAKFGFIAYLAITLFNLITLPVEFDASNRAKKELVGLGILDSNELVGAKQMLDSAALTYVAALVSSLSWLLYFFLASRD